LSAEGSEKTRQSITYQSNQHPVLFIVFGHQRTGSTLLASKLNSHPRIRCYEEVFLPWTDSSPSVREWLEARDLPKWLRVIPSIRTSFLTSLYDINNIPSNIDAVGFKVMYNQMSLWPKFAYLMPTATYLLQDPVLGNWLRTNRVLVVHALRRNHLKILVSHELAARSGHFHSRNEPILDRKVFISLRSLKPRLRRIQQAEKAARNIIAGLPAIEIWYESFTGVGGAQDDARLCDALGQPVPAGGLTSPLRKLSSDNLRDTIANYEQVAAYLSGTRFEQFLQLAQSF
jgi:LPS sulfotransferase NodH